MNSVILIGRLTRDPELRFTPNQMAVATFTMAVDRPARAGEQRKADFIRITVFGKQAENCDRFLGKGRLVGVQGRLQTGSYQNKNGDTVYTTDVYANQVQFLDRGEKTGVQAPSNNNNFNNYAPSTLVEDMVDMPDSFQSIDEDVPF